MQHCPGPRWLPVAVPAQVDANLAGHGLGETACGVEQVLHTHKGEAAGRTFELACGPTHVSRRREVTGRQVECAVEVDRELARFVVNVMSPANAIPVGVVPVTWKAASVVPGAGLRHGSGRWSGSGPGGHRPAGELLGPCPWR